MKNKIIYDIYMFIYLIKRTEIRIGRMDGRKEKKEREKKSKE
jgi:hypothetical protein